MFTLLELIVGMGVLVLLMTMLFWFVSTVQQAWDLSESTAQIYENSRNAFELLERDLHTMVISSETNFLIKLHVGDPQHVGITNYGDDLHICAVSTVEPHDDADSRLCEISYKHHADADLPDTQYQLRRQLVCDNDTTNWDCINPGASWYQNDNVGDNAQPFELLIDGVEDFEILFYDTDGNVMGAGSTVSRPNQIVINMVLFDIDLKDLPEDARLASKRSFSKVFYLSHLATPD
jgi:type II secretory pathway pseudopilin PulG